MTFLAFSFLLVFTLVKEIIIFTVVVETVILLFL